MTVQELNKKYKFNIPEVCPSCGKPLKVNESGIVYCDNEACGQKIHHKASKLIHIWSIKEMGPRMIEDLLDKENITKISQFIDVILNHVDKVYEACGSKNAYKVQVNLKKVLSQPMTADKFLAAFDFDGFGQKKISSLVEEGFTIDDFISGSKSNEMMNVMGWTEKSVSDFLEKVSSSKEDILESLKYVKIESKEEAPTEGKLSGLSFCFTGSNDYKDDKRKALEELVVSLGGTISSVNKTLSYLVSSEEGTGKMQKAEKLGVKIISYQDFYEMID